MVTYTKPQQRKKEESENGQFAVNKGPCLHFAALYLLIFGHFFHVDDRHLVTAT